MDKLFPIVRVQLVQPQALSFLIRCVEVITGLYLVSLFALVAILPDAFGAIERGPVDVASKLVSSVCEA